MTITEEPTQPSTVAEQRDPIDLRIGRFAEQHHGLISDAEAERLGISPKAIRYRCAQGRLEKVHPHVYRCAGAPVTTHQQLLAACWTTAGGSVVSHRSAAKIWGIAQPDEPVVEVSMNRPRCPDLEGVVLHRSSDLAEDHVTEMEGLPITTVTRTIIDLGAVLPWWEVERALEAANSRRLTSIAEVHAMRDALGKSGRNGVGVIGEILERRGLGDVDSHSVLESMFANLRRDYGIEGLEYQHRVIVAGRERYIDFAIPALKIALELKGYDTHSRWKVFTDDCIRGAELTLLGWTVVEFTWEDLVHRPGYVARVIRELVRRASASK